MRSFLSGARVRRKGSIVSGFSRTVVVLFILTTPAFAQIPPPMEAITLDEAVSALKNNPTIAQASEGILRAESLLQQARAATLPNLNAAFTNVVVDTERRFDDIVTTPRSQATLSANLAMPILAASRWAATTQARDQVEIANLSTTDVRREIAVATAQAYSRDHRVEASGRVSLRARETSLAHLDYARRRLEAGAGTRVNELRAGRKREQRRHDSKSPWPSAHRTGKPLAS